MINVRKRGGASSRKRWRDSRPEMVVFFFHLSHLHLPQKIVELNMWHILVHIYFYSLHTGEIKFRFYCANIR